MDGYDLINRIDYTKAYIQTIIIFMDELVEVLGAGEVSDKIRILQFAMNDICNELLTTSN